MGYVNSNHLFSQLYERLKKVSELLAYIKELWEDSLPLHGAYSGPHTSG